MSPLKYDCGESAGVCIISDDRSVNFYGAVLLSIVVVCIYRHPQLQHCRYARYQSSFHPSCYYITATVRKNQIYHSSICQHDLVVLRYWTSAEFRRTPFVGSYLPYWAWTDSASVARWTPICVTIDIYWREYAPSRPSTSYRSIHIRPYRFECHEYVQTTWALEP